MANAKFADFFKIVEPKSPKTNYVSTESVMGINNWGWLSQVIKGAATRIARYSMYDQMINDIDICRALDIIAEEMTTFDVPTGSPLIIEYRNQADKSVDARIVTTLREALKHWSEVQEFDSGRIFGIAKYTCAYGDLFFRKTTDFRKWTLLPQADVLGIEINEHMEVVNYHLRGVSSSKMNPGVDIVPAAGVVRFSMADGMSKNSPFGDSVFDSVIKTWRQLRLMEDSAIIYRMVRAPERRVFYVDVGNMPPQKVKAYLEQVRNDMRQRRGPKTQGDHTTVDSSYNAEEIGEDIFMSTTANGRGSRVETLPGGQTLGQIDDITYFRNKLYRGLRVPVSYIAGTDEKGAGGQQVNYGKAGMAYIEELRFANYVRRLQNRIETTFDDQFKSYLRAAQINIDPNLFRIRLADPQNFAVYRQNALDAEQLNVYGNVKDIDYLSRRFAMKRYLGMTEEDIQVNEEMLAEERGLNETDDGPSIVQQLYDTKFEEAREIPKPAEPEEEKPADEPAPDEEVPADDTAEEQAGATEEKPEVEAEPAAEPAPKEPEIKLDL